MTHWLRKSAPAVYAIGSIPLLIGLAAQPVLADPPGGTAGWTQVFGDEFSGTSIDSTKWFRCPTYLDANGVAQPTSHWAGNGDTAGYPTSNVTVANGVANLRSARESFTDSIGTAHSYSSAWMCTDGKFYASPGMYLECSMQVANTPGLDPAFWLNGQSHAWPPEIDICEIPSAGTAGASPGAGTTTAFGNFYRDEAGTVHASTGNYTLGSTQFQAGYHTFGLRWETNLLIYYVDGVERWRTTYKVPTEPCYLIISEELNNNSGWYGDPADGTYPTYGHVDWVHIWQATTPAAPTSLTTTAGNGQVNLSWGASSSANSYNVYRGTTPAGEGATPVATGLTNTNYTDFGLTNGTTYYYKVAAINSAGTSSQSNEANATPAGWYANNVVLTPLADTYIRDGSYASANYGLATSLVVKNAGAVTGNNRKSYFKFAVPSVAGNITSAYLNLYGGLGSADSLTVSTSPVADTSWTETGITWNNAPAISGSALSTLTVSNTAPQTLSWDVKNYVTANLGNTISLGVASPASTTNSQALSVSSREVTNNPPQLVITTSASAVLAAPTNLTATAGNAGVTLNWTASSGATSYNLYRSTTPGGEGTTAIVTGITGTSYANTGLSNDTTYYYKLAAVNGNGRSAFSNETSAQPYGGGTLTLTPIADSYVRDGTYASTNYGTATSLAIKYAGPVTGNNRKAYFKFDLSGISGTVSSAQLRFYSALPGADTVTIGAYSAADSSWAETGITWNNAPTLSSSALSSLSVTNTTAQYLTWDVSSYVGGHLGTVVTLSLAGSSLSSGAQVLSGNSKEAGTNPPQLLITTY